MSNHGHNHNGNGVPRLASGASNGHDAPAILRTETLSKTYTMGQAEFPVLRGVDLSIAAGSFTTIVGHSGCGKSTLLHIMGLLDKPTQGRIYYDGVDAFGQSSTWRDRTRNRRVGFVFQFYHLLPELSVLGNVMLPNMIYYGPVAWLRAKYETRSRAEQMLEQVGLKDRMAFPPNRLSGGERQRAAIARALVHDPDIVFADEPTGNLDTQAGWQVFEMLRSLAVDRKKTVVMVTHDSRFEAEGGSVLHLAGGRIVDPATAERIALEHEHRRRGQG